MKRTFIRTKNVKRFVGLMEELQKLPLNIPKLAWRTWTRKNTFYNMVGDPK